MGVGGGERGAEVLPEMVPVLWVRLLHTLLLGDDEARKKAAQDPEAHGDSVVVMAVDNSALELVRPAGTHDLDSVFKFPSGDSALSKLLDHDGDTVAFLYPLVRHPVDASGAVCHRSKHRRCHEGISHRLHVDVAEPLQGTSSRSLDRCVLRILLDSTSHLGQQVAELSVSLHTAGTNRCACDLAPGDGGDGEGVGGGGGIGLHVEYRGVLVPSARDLVAV
mmetsp:Transcript_68589/g.143068  ORF Transcript_68589/g.143068 Transcript_68589/m.143068 type:complete len:221 (+) Transcript_68589:2242-2904(+)